MVVGVVVVVASKVHLVECTVENIKVDRF